jgi:hypothetical protein
VTETRLPVQTCRLSVVRDVQRHPDMSSVRRERRSAFCGQQKPAYKYTTIQSPLSSQFYNQHVAIPSLANLSLRLDNPHLILWDAGRVHTHAQRPSSSLKLFLEILAVLHKVGTNRKLHSGNMQDSTLLDDILPLVDKRLDIGLKPTTPQKDAGIQKDQTKLATTANGTLPMATRVAPLPTMYPEYETSPHLLMVRLQSQLCDSIKNMHATHHHPLSTNPPIRNCL